jgi:VWFA-related protein
MELRKTASATAVAVLLAFSATFAAESPADRSTAVINRQSPQQSIAPTLQVYSRETVVDVVVTDAKGQPIHNLQQSDFTIEEDGKPQPIRSFLETSRDTARDTPQTASAPRKLPPHVFSNVQPAPVAGAVNIVLLDALNVASIDQMSSRLEAEKYLKSMPPGTQVALFGLGNGLRLLEGFTSTPGTLIAAMNDKKNSLLPPGSNTTPCVAPELTLDALRQIAAFVASIKGRKNLIWFVGGSLPLSDPCDPDLQRQTFETLAASQVAIYPIDVRALFNDPTSSAANSATKIKVNTGAAAADMQVLFFKNTAGFELAMEALAEATGGVAYYNTNAVKDAFAKAIDNGANYYTLSYVPPSVAYDGRYHRITVKVSRPGVQLSYRRGYGADDITKVAANTGIHTTLAATTPSPQTNSMAASMARFAPPATQLLFDVKIAPTTIAPKPTDPPVMGALDPKLKGKPLTRFDLLYFLPVTQITFTDTAGNTHSGSIEFDIVASDVFGKIISSESQTMDLPLTQEEYQQFIKTPFQFFQQLDLPPGQTFLRVGILDKTSNKVGTLEIPVTVPSSSTTHSAATAPNP